MEESQNMFGFLTEGEVLLDVEVVVLALVGFLTGDLALDQRVLFV